MKNFNGCVNLKLYENFDFLKTIPKALNYIFDGLKFTENRVEISLGTEET